MGEIFKKARGLPGEGCIWLVAGASGGDISGQMKGGVRLCLVGRADGEGML